jgi:hypothetical protein
MPKAKKVKAGGVAVYADGRVLSRLQSVTADTDLGVEEIREITNEAAVEFVEGIPTVTISLEGNLYGKRENLAALSGAEGLLQKSVIASGGGVGGDNSPSPLKTISPQTFDGTSVDIVMQLEEDGVLKRSAYMGDAFFTSWGINLDVGGVGTESVTLEADNKVWYLNNYLELIVMSGYMIPVGAGANSGVRYTSNYNTNYFRTALGVTDFSDVFTPLFVTADGEKVVDSNGDVVLPDGVAAGDDIVGLYPGEDVWAQISGGKRLRVVGHKNSPNQVITASQHVGYITDQAPPVIGGVRKGMVEIFLVSGSMYNLSPGPSNWSTEFLRLQTCSIDADMSREALDELGNFKSYDRSLTFPISATVNFSALSSDLEAWGRFAGYFPEGGLHDISGEPGVDSIEFRDFVRDAGVLIKIYDDDEANVSREHLMTITVSGVRVATESFGVDAGGNATQDFSCSADNFVVS